jgi:hypothetical protein
MQKLKKIGTKLSKKEQKQLSGGNGVDCPVGYCSNSPFICCETRRDCAGQGRCLFL